MERKNLPQQQLQQSHQSTGYAGRMEIDPPVAAEIKALIRGNSFSQGQKRMKTPVRRTILEISDTSQRQKDCLRSSRRSLTDLNLRVREQEVASLSEALAFHIEPKDSKIVGGSAGSIGGGVSGIGSLSGRLSVPKNRSNTPVSILSSREPGVSSSEMEKSHGAASKLPSSVRLGFHKAHHHHIYHGPSQIYFDCSEDLAYGPEGLGPSSPRPKLLKALYPTHNGLATDHPAGYSHPSNSRQGEKPTEADEEDAYRYQFSRHLSGRDLMKSKRTINGSVQLSLYTLPRPDSLRPLLQCSGPVNGPTTSPTSVKAFINSSSKPLAARNSTKRKVFSTLH